jgi:hypothetical protein
MDARGGERKGTFLKTSGWLRGVIGRLLLKASLGTRHRAMPDEGNPIALFEQDPSETTALVVHLDATAQSLRDVLEETEPLHSIFQRIVYLTDCADFSILRARKCIFDYVPPRSEQLRHRPDAAWSEFMVDRRELLTAKWTPAVVLSFGTTIEDWVERTKREEAEMRASRPPWERGSSFAPDGA